MICPGCAKEVRKPLHDSEGRTWHEWCLKRAAGARRARERVYAPSAAERTEDYLAWGAARYGLPG